MQSDCASMMLKSLDYQKYPFGQLNNFLRAFQHVSIWCVIPDPHSAEFQPADHLMGAWLWTRDGALQ